MSAGPNRRFPRTARAMPEARATIERDKIRHRRPNDLMFDDAETPPTRRSLLTDDFVDDRTPGNDAYENGGRDDDVDMGWANEDESSQAPVWDDESEDDWVLAGDDEPDSQTPDSQTIEDDFYEEDEGGVVWEDEAFPEPENNPDEVTFGQEETTFGFAPEVELAGRRDVRPKPPRPAPPPGQARAPENRGQRRPTRRQGRPSQQRRDWAEDIDPTIQAHPAREASFEQPDRPAETFARPPASSPPAGQGRFSRTRAMLGVADDDAHEEVLQQPRRGPTNRRRQARAAPPPVPSNMPKRDRYGAIRTGRRHGRGLIAVLLLALLAGGGWFAYQSLGPDGIRQMVDRVTALLPLPQSSRTAADTSFGETETGETLSADQALADLEQRIKQQEQGAATAGQTPAAADPATTSADGPPIPKFKPLPGQTRSLSADATSSTDGAQVAANDGETGEDDVGAFTIFERLWRYINPG